jgi:hypothetical protein
MRPHQRIAQADRRDGRDPSAPVRVEDNDADRGQAIGASIMAAGSSEAVTRGCRRRVQRTRSEEKALGAARPSWSKTVVVQQVGQSRMMSPAICVT